MKLLLAYNLFNAIADIASIAAKEPAKFSVQFKLAIAENRRVLLPHAQQFEEIRESLIKQYGEEFDQPIPDTEDPETKEPQTRKAFHVKPDSKDRPKFDKDIKKLCDQKVTPRLRFIYEADLGEAPLTVDHLSILQECEVLKPNAK